jgi:putative transposase
MFGRFKIRMEQKSTEFDSSLVFADRWYPSTQRCSECEFIKTGDEKLGLNGDNHGNPHNKYVCYNCGIILDRDENAVENLLQYSEELMVEIRKFFKKTNNYI